MGMEGIEGRKKLKELKAGKNCTEGRKKWQERMEGRKATLVLCFTNGITRDESGVLVEGRKEGRKKERKEGIEGRRKGEIGYIKEGRREGIEGRKEGQNEQKGGKKEEIEQKKGRN